MYEVNYSISEYPEQGQFATRFIPKKSSIPEFINFIKSFPAIPYTNQQFLELKKTNKKKFGELKNKNGSIIGCTLTRRLSANVDQVSMLPIDLDFSPPGTAIQDISAKIPAAHFIYTTSSHTHETPKFRVWVFLKEKILQKDVRRMQSVHKHFVYSLFNKDQIDETMFSLSQPMFLACRLLDKDLEYSENLNLPFFDTWGYELKNQGEIKISNSTSDIEISPGIEGSLEWFINTQLNYYDDTVQEILLFPEYSNKNNRWVHINSGSQNASATITAGGLIFNTGAHKIYDSIYQQYPGAWGRTVYMGLLLKFCSGNPDLMEGVLEKYFPLIFKIWVDKYKFSLFKIELKEIDLEPQDDKQRYLEIKRKYEAFKNPMLQDTFLGALVKQCTALCAFTNQETFILSNLEALFGIISSTLQCIPIDDNDIGKINLNGYTASTFRMHVGETGDGKSDSFKIIFSRLIKNFENIKSLIYLNDLGSAAATQIQIAKSPTIGFAQDEITAFFEEAINENSLHSSTLRSLLKYYSPTDSGKVDIKEEAYGVVRNPHITVVGGTTFNFLGKFTKSKAGEAGYWRRVEVIIQDLEMLPKRMETYLGKRFIPELIEEMSLLDHWIKRAKYKLDVRAERIQKKKLKSGYEFYEFLPGFAKAPIYLSQEAKDFLFDIGEEYRLCSEECGNELFKVKFRTCHDLIIRKAIVYAFTEKLPREWLIPSQEVIDWDNKVNELDNILLEESERERIALELGQTVEAQTANRNITQNQERLDQLRNNAPSKFPSMIIEKSHCEWAYSETMKRFFTEMRAQYARSLDSQVMATDKISTQDLDALFKNIEDAWVKLSDKEKLKGLELNSINAFKQRLKRIRKKVKKIEQKDIIDLMQNRIQFKLEESIGDRKKIIIISVT